MSYLSDLYDTKRRYETLRGKVRDLANNLDKVINKFDEPINNTKDNLIIDGSSPLSIKLSNIKSDLVAKKNFLSNSVISNINSNISYYEDKINEEEERITNLELS